MRTYTFKTADFDEVTVQAASERQARTLVMQLRWGPATATFPNLGTGLDLIKEQEEEA